MNKIKCTRNEMYKILKKAISDCHDGKILIEEYSEIEFEIIPLDFSKFPQLKADTREYINKNFDKETTDENGNYMLKRFIGDSLALWYKNKENLHCNYAPYGFYHSHGGFGFNDEEMLIYTWGEGDTTVTLFSDEATYLKERKATEKWYEENT